MSFPPIFSLTQNCESLEAKNHELHRHIDELSVALETERRKYRRLLEDNDKRIVKPNHLNLKLKADEAQNDEVSLFASKASIFLSNFQLQASLQTPTNANNAVDAFAQSKLSNRNSVTDNGSAIDDSGQHLAEMEELDELRVKYEVACQQINELELQIQCLTEETTMLKNKISSLETEGLTSVHRELMMW